MPVQYLKMDAFTVGAKPSFAVDDNGELATTWGDQGADAVPIEGMYVLLDSQCRPINAANEYLIYCKTIEQDKDLETKAKGLMHYFDFLEQIGMTWDEMPRTQYQRPTYRFVQKYLQVGHDTVLPNGRRQLAGTTARAYRGAMVGFYTYWLGRGVEFRNKPLKYSFAEVKDKGALGHINKVIRVTTTDLKLDIKDGGGHHDTPAKLMPLSLDEQQALHKVLSGGMAHRNTKVYGESREVKTKLSWETHLMIGLSLWTGLRRWEVLSFSNHHVRWPKVDEPICEVYIGPGGRCHTKGGVSRTIEIPPQLMRHLYRYKQSKRYQERLEKFLAANEVKPKVDANDQPVLDKKGKPVMTGDQMACLYPPLLLTAQGKEYSLSSLNARWGEIRNTLRKIDGMEEFRHKFQNLRSTYATNQARIRLRLKDPKSGEPRFTRDEVEGQVQALLGHENPDTSRHYIKFLDEEKRGRAGHRLWELGLMHIVGEDGDIGAWNKLLGNVEKANG